MQWIDESSLAVISLVARSIEQHRFAAAVLGRPFSLTELSVITAREVTDLLPLVETLVDARTLEAPGRHCASGTTSSARQSSAR